MLSEQETKEIEAEAARLPLRRSACIDALMVVQRHRGWVPDEAVREIADLLGMGAAEVEGVATFYSLVFRRPVGRHVILVCDSVSCWILGYEGLRRRLCRRLGIELGGTTEDGRFTLLPIPCLGTCDHAPALMIDDDLHREVVAEKVDEILEGYR